MTFYQKGFEETNLQSSERARYPMSRLSIFKITPFLHTGSPRDFTVLVSFLVSTLLTWSRRRKCGWTGGGGDELHFTVIGVTWSFHNTPVSVMYLFSALSGVLFVCTIWHFGFLFFCRLFRFRLRFTGRLRTRAYLECLQSVPSSLRARLCMIYIHTVGLLGHSIFFFLSRLLI